MYFSCQQRNEDVPAAHALFLNKYKPLLGNAGKKYLSLYSIPKNIIKLNSKSEKIALLTYKDYPFIEPELMGVPRYAAFHELEYVFRDGTLLFLDDRAPDRDPIPIERGDKQTTSFYFSHNKLEKLTSLKGDMAFSYTVEKILVNGKMREFYFDKLDNRYNYYEGKRVVALTDSKTFPEPFSRPFLLGPITSPNAICYSVLSWMDMNNKAHSDKAILLYKWQDKRVEKTILLPATDAYKPFHNFDWQLRSLDKQNRFYLRLKADFSFKYQGLKNSHVMIYDATKDNLYNIFFPIFDETNEDEQLIDTHFVLGEDGLIYCQLVTDKAYHLFKIDPQWQLPGESMDYDPVFFSFYPELRSAWDKN
jgi:hypothetical protein